MTNERFTALTEALLADCWETMNQTKGKDYSSTEERLANFKEIALDSGLEPTQVWMVLIDKHFDAIRRAIKNNPKKPTKKSEPLRENFKDLIVYSFLGYALVEEAHEN